MAVDCQLHHRQDWTMRSSASAAHAPFANGADDRFWNGEAGKMSGREASSVESFRRPDNISVRPSRQNGGKVNDVDALNQDVEENVETTRKSLFKTTRERESRNMAERKPKFSKFGQFEPPTTRIKNIILQYCGESSTIGMAEIVKELIQNADDARATQVHLILDKRFLPADKVWEEWRGLQGPAFCAYNNAIFTEEDIQAIQKLGVGSKSSDPDKTGQFGIGFNVMYQLTDCPSILSDGKDLCLFDPHSKYVPGATTACPGGHINLHQDLEFKKTWTDVLRGYLPGYVQQEGGTIFRFPLRHKHMVSDISHIFYNEDSLKDLEYELRNTEFKSFVHNCLLFTKTISRVGASVIDTDGKLHTLFEIKRKINPGLLKDLKEAYKSTSESMKLVLEGKLSLRDIPKKCVTYKLTTVDGDYTTGWMVNQSFGFHGNLEREDESFLEEFLCQDVSGKKFSPIAGVAAKLRGPVQGAAFCFLQLPIQTGLSVHVNGHFAIHSSRRGLWTNTAFGSWNRILQRYVIVPSYCSLLKTATKAAQIANLTSWYNRLLPDTSSATDSYFQEVSRLVYLFLQEYHLNVVPITRSLAISSKVAHKLEFHSMADTLFLAGLRDVHVEKMLLVLGHNVCAFPEVSLRLLHAKTPNLRFMCPRAVMECLRQSANKLGLLRPVNQTPFLSHENVRKVLEYCLIQNSEADRTYLALDGVPLCLTDDGNLRVFDVQSPVFVSLEYRAILPNRHDLFLHPEISFLFSVKGDTKTPLPVRQLGMTDVAHFVDKDAGYVQEPAWRELMWRFMKRHIGRNTTRLELQPLEHLPLLPTSSGRFYTIVEGKQIFSMARTGKDMITILNKLGLPSLDPKQVVTEDVTDHDVETIAKPCVLDGSELGDLLEVLTVNGNQALTSVQFTEEEAETMIHFINSGLRTLRTSSVFREPVRHLPIFQTVGGEYSAIGSEAVILDESIPLHGVTSTMMRSNCVLLRERKTYFELYRILGLSKKSSVLVYIDHIFPHFTELQSEIREAHLQCVRDTVLPMVSGGPVELSQMSQRMFAMALKKLDFIPWEDALLPACRFFAPELELLELLDNHHPLPDQYRGEEWRDMLEVAGLKVTVSPEEYVQIGLKIASLGENMEMATNKAQLLLSEIIKNHCNNGILYQISKIPFIPIEPDILNEELCQLCPPFEPGEHFVSLRNSLMYQSRHKRDILKHSVLTWTNCVTLPAWADIPSELIHQLGVKFIPDVESVVKHCTMLSEVSWEELSDDGLRLMQFIFNCAYDFLSQCCMCFSKSCPECMTVATLRKKEIVVLNEGKIKIMPSKLVLNLPDDIDTDTLHPYVYKRPLDMVQHDDLFRRLGAQAAAKADTFAQILSHLRAECGENTMDLNQREMASSAVYGLFMTLRSNPVETLLSRPLFLPSDKAVMTLSFELIARDNELVAKKYKDNTFDYLCKLTACNLYRNPKDYVLLLPHELRPILLSDLVHEDITIDAECDLMDTESGCPFLDKYQQVLGSETLSNALVALAAVPYNESGPLQERLEVLQTADVRCFQKMTSQLLVKEKPLGGAPSEKYCHLQVNQEEYLYTLFIKHNHEYPGDANVSFAVADVIKSHLNVDIDSGQIVRLLRCSVDQEETEDILAGEGTALNPQEDLLDGPSLGTEVPDQKFFAGEPNVRLQPKEYVGYLQTDALTGNGVMVFARVVNEVTELRGKAVGNTFKNYKIDTGVGHAVDAQALDLYREGGRFPGVTRGQRSKGGVEEEEDGESDDDEGAACRDCIDLSSEIDKTTAMLTQLIDETYSDVRWVPLREKLAARLLRTWESNKNDPDAAEAEVVLAHVQHELERVKNEYSYVVDLHKEQEEENRRAELAAQGLVDPNPQCAQRLFAVALRDLPAADTMVEVGLAEWCCALCTEVVRKVLVATIVNHGLATAEQALSIPTLQPLLLYIGRLKDRPSQIARDVDVFRRTCADYIEEFDPSSRMYSRPEVTYTEQVARKVVDVTYRIVTYLAEFNQIVMTSSQTESVVDENMNSQE